MSTNSINTDPQRASDSPSSTPVVKPEILKGTRDFLPAEMAKRQYTADIIRQAFTRFGYDAIDTPSIEYAKTILGKYGEEGNKLTYRFEDNGGRDICLRYDQTVPFARVVAANYQDLPMPFKRYQIGNVWRADKPAKGRYREFTQFDIDIIGTNSLVADAEIAAVINRVFADLGFTDYLIKFNSRRLMNSILDSLNVEDDKHTAVIRVVDKLEKIGVEKVKKELEPIISPATADKVMEIMTLTGSNEEKINALNEFDTSEIENFLALARGFNIKEENIEFDPSIARGLDYYTGIVFEAILPNVPIGSLCGGGRYDNLCGTFCKEKFSGVGVAFGFDRIVLAMEELGLFKNVGLNSQVLVTLFDEATIPNAQAILNDLQEAGVNAEIYTEPAKLGKQFKYADKKQIPFVVICGPEEMEKGEVTIKVMESGDQKTIPRAQVGEYVVGYQS